MEQKRTNTQQILTVPNILSMFRVLLAGVFAVVYWNADSRTDLYYALGILVLSGVTDFADGKIARHFHMVSELGKVLDPFADKLTQAVVAFCLCRSFEFMKLLLLVLVIKELSQGIFGLYAMRHGGRNDGAMWCGKISTFYLYAMMVLFLLVPAIPVPVTGALVLVGVALLLWSLGSYLLLFRSMIRHVNHES